MTVEEALAVADRSSRERILAATAEVLGRNGMTKLSLLEVALRAADFAPDALPMVRLEERELLDAFVVWERAYSRAPLPRRPPTFRNAKGSTRRCA